MNNLASIAERSLEPVHLLVGIGLAVMVAGMSSVLATAEITSAEGGNTGLPPQNDKQTTAEPRAVVSRLIAKAAEGNEDVASRWVDDNSQHLMVNLNMLTRFNEKIRIDRIVGGGPLAASRAEAALVITKPIRNAPAVSPDVQERPLVFRLVRQGSEWDVERLRFESPERIDALVEDFLKELDTPESNSARMTGVIPAHRLHKKPADVEVPKPGDIIIEAEAYANRTQGAEMGWYEIRVKDGSFAEGPEIGEQPAKHVSGSRGNYMQALGKGVGYIPPTVKAYTGPVLEYRVRIDKPGCYTLLTRWAGMNQESDSFYAYIKCADGELLTSRSPHFFMYHALHPGWKWRSNGLEDTTYCNAQGCPDRATWPIPNQGEYTICIAGREGGTAVDAIILRRIGDAPKFDERRAIIPLATGADDTDLPRGRAAQQCPGRLFAK